MKAWHVFVAGFGGMLCGAVVFYMFTQQRFENIERRREWSWWCSSNSCTRKEADCVALTEHSDGQCYRARRAFCPMGEPNLYCADSLTMCERRIVSRGSAGSRAYCVGVE